MNQLTFGEAVKAARLRLGLTQRALAERLTELGLSIDQASIARMEKGAREPRLGEAFALADYLGFDVTSVAPKEGHLTHQGLEDRAIHNFYSARRAIEEYLGCVVGAIGLYRSRPDENDPGYRTRQEYEQTMQSLLEGLPGREWEFDAKTVNWKNLTEIAGSEYLRPFLDALTADLDDESPAP